MGISSQAMINGVMLLAIGVGFAFGFKDDLIAATRSNSFAPTSGVITGGEAVGYEVGDVDGSTRSYDAAQITYKYGVAGKDYVGGAVYLGDPTPGRSTQQLLSEYPKGSKQTVYYDPQAPAVSCLERGYSPLNLGILGLVALMVILAGLAVVVGSAKAPGLLRASRK